MGCNEAVDDKCDDDEKPYHRVYFDAYHIDKHEVTADQYYQCVKGRGCSADNLTKKKKTGKEELSESIHCNWRKPGKENYPMNCVDWSQAQAYCGWAGKRLPTEAEWEKAARGTDGRKFGWGNEWPPPPGSGNIADETAKKKFPEWEIIDGYDDGYATTSPVCTYTNERNPYGLCDMAGNVSEWVKDWYKKEYYGESPSRNPQSPSAGKWNIYRGQSAYTSKNPDVYHRRKNYPQYRETSLGFRCVRNN